MNQQVGSTYIELHFQQRLTTFVMELYRQTKNSNAVKTPCMLQAHTQLTKRHH